MKKNAGVWIDHHRAFIVRLAGTMVETQVVTSHVEKQPRRAHGSISTASEARPADDNAQRAYRGHLDRYYAAVVKKIRDADAIWILGPAEAKVEFNKYIEKLGCAERVIGIETVDKMTDPQIIAKVREHFGGVAEIKSASHMKVIQ